MIKETIIKESISLINTLIDDMDFSPYIIDERVSNIVASKARTMLNVEAPVYFEELGKSTLGRHSYCLTSNGTLSVVQINECLSPSNVAELYKKDENSATFFFERIFESVLHEYRHVFQRKIGMYSLEYIKSSEDYDSYRNQACEVDAREWASKIWEENGAQLLSAIFNFLEDLYFDLLEDGWK